jgi:dTDP-4-dehydrorhamnose reductase
MRILITGSAGMLGHSVFPAFVDAGHDVTATDLVPHSMGNLLVGKLDVRDFDAVTRSVEDTRPEMVLHLAAETDLETCEGDHDHAYRTNTIGTQYVAIACRQHGIPIVYISTAGVFDGLKKNGPYTEFDEPNPINVYGDSKYRGELVVRQLVPEHFIVRAGWMIGGGASDHKFIGKVIEQVRQGAKTIYAVTDKFGTPTYTKDFAANLLRLVETPFYGLYHMACRGEGTRFDVARVLLDHFGLGDVALVPVGSEHFSQEFPAPRPRS